MDRILNTAFIKTSDAIFLEIFEDIIGQIFREYSYSIYTYVEMRKASAKISIFFFFH